MKNILITGSTFWNPGDDIVRDGVRNLLGKAIAEEFGEPINWHFYSFSQPQNRLTPCAEDLNLTYADELADAFKVADYIVVPGLAVGLELAHFYRVLRGSGQAHKLILAGGMNENPYCATHCNSPMVAECLSKARLIVGRTRGHPAEMDGAAIPYQTLPCPSIHAEPATVMYSQPNRRLAMSIQVPHGNPWAVNNQSTGHEAVTTSMEAAHKLMRDGDTVIAHHKSEVPYLKSFWGIDARFSPFLEDLRGFYRGHSMVISTRLHSVLWAHSMGIPGYVVNDTERHVAALEMFPHVHRGTKVSEIMDWVEYLWTANNWQTEWDIMFEARCRAERSYVDLLRSIL